MAQNLDFKHAKFFTSPGSKQQFPLLGTGHEREVLPQKEIGGDIPTAGDDGEERAGVVVRGTSGVTLRAKGRE